MADDIEVVGPVASRRLDQVHSVRLDPDQAADLRDLANRRGENVSDLLRVGAALVLGASDVELDRAMRCPSCEGSGKRRWGRDRNCGGATEVSDAG